MRSQVILKKKTHNRMIHSCRFYKQQSRLLMIRKGLFVKRLFGVDKHGAYILLAAHFINFGANNSLLPDRLFFLNIFRQSFA